MSSRNILQRHQPILHQKLQIMQLHAQRWTSVGLTILIRKDISQHQIIVDSELQAIATKVTQHKPRNIYSI